MTAMGAEEKAGTGRVSMTVRVSRDSGRTWGAQVAYPGSRNEKPLSPAASAAWPPCECPKHRA